MTREACCSDVLSDCAVMVETGRRANRIVDQSFILITCRYYRAKSGCAAADWREQAFTRIDPAIFHQLRVTGVTENRVPDHVGARPHDYTKKSLRGLMRDGRKGEREAGMPPVDE